MRRTRIWRPAALGAFLACAAVGPGAFAAGVVSLDRTPQVHDIAVAGGSPGRVLLATHQGLFLAAADGTATRLSGNADDLMAFAVHPTDPDVFLASGYPAGGKIPGITRSNDGGQSWSAWVEGANGPVHFHALEVSQIDPNLVFGVQKVLQVSRDGGRTWEAVGPLPGKTFNLATSARDVDTLYAASIEGLFQSRDGGRSWRSAFPAKRPATAVHETADGRILAYIVGVGLVAAEAGRALEWKMVSGNFDDRALLDLAVDPGDAKRVYGVADTGAVMTSKDGGKTWTSFENNHRATPETVDRGRKLYEEACQSCHGVRGVGERPKDMYAKDEFGFVAPPLDNSAHGWHHSDQNLVDTILNGSPRNKRMVAWKDILSREDAMDIVTYIKSLWSFRSLACQGSRHMRCM